MGEARITKALGKAIERILEVRRWKMSTLADEVGTSRATIARWSKGEVQGNFLESVVRIFDLAESSMDRAFGLKPPNRVLDLAGLDREDLKQEESRYRRALEDAEQDARQYKRVLDVIRSKTLETYFRETADVSRKEEEKILAMFTGMGFTLRELHYVKELTGKLVAEIAAQKEEKGKSRGKWSRKSMQLESGPSFLTSLERLKEILSKLKSAKWQLRAAKFTQVGKERYKKATEGLTRELRELRLGEYFGLEGERFKQLVDMLYFELSRLNARLQLSSEWNRLTMTVDTLDYELARLQAIETEQAFEAEAAIEKEPSLDPDDPQYYRLLAERELAEAQRDLYETRQRLTEEEASLYNDYEGETPPDTTSFALDRARAELDRTRSALESAKRRVEEFEGDEQSAQDDKENRGT